MLFRSLSAGANRFLTKPVDARGLLECIASLSKNIRKAKASKPILPRESRKHLQNNFAESEWFDNIVLHELDILGDDPEFIKTLLLNFEKEGLKHVGRLKQALQDDYLEYREQLHALKGSATELGAGKLVQTCQQAEALKPYDMNTEKVNQMSVRVEKVFNKTVAALNTAATVNQDIYQSKTTD